MSKQVTLNLRCKAHRRIVKRMGMWARLRHHPHRYNDRFMGTHRRWWALGQYALKHGRHCSDLKTFLSDVDFVGVNGAVDWSE